MADFKKAYEIVRAHEGGYANDPNDRGGETYKGIARKSFPNWPGWNIVDYYKKLGKITSLNRDAGLQEQVESFYKKNFWDILRLSMVQNQSIANELFDTGVNMGVGVAALFLQRSLNVTNRQGKDYNDLQLDGSIGAVTLSVLNNHNRPLDVLKTLNILQGAKYVSICEANPSQEVFYSGWLKRVNL